MNAKRIPGRFPGERLLLSAWFLFHLTSPATAQLELPVITSIQRERTNVLVSVRVPPGLRRVTLESRERLGPGGWEPRAVTRLDGIGGVTVFRLPFSRRWEVMRVRGDAAEPLPATFYSGTNSFLGEAGGVALPGVLGPGVDRTAGPDSAAREVEESDIWKMRGSTLYFFNQYRGLQVIDIADPDEAVVRGTLALPAAGEQMYLLGTEHVVLLARDGCAYNESQVLIVADTASAPVVVRRLPVPGTIRESRMVGSALYVASQFYRPVTDSTNTAWEWGTLVSAFDLADPARPVARNTLWYSGYGHVVAATDTYLFVVTQSPINWWQSIVRIIDITAPEGTMNAYGTITAAGRLADKFKLDYTGSRFTIISEDRHATNGTRLVTRLETFRLPDPRSMGPLGIVKLGELELGHGESLRGTRFEGDRVYVVTFFQIDPLWVVDLADPARPRIAGSVDVPGWSTYIQPLGDRLVTMGVETGRVAVSLFDVGNANAPSLLSRVLLGETWSWSEANYNEKAFAVLPGAGLILVPYNGDITNRYTSVLQLVDLEADSLTARGRIESSFQFRRATVYSDRILSISGWEFLSVDASDRDHPVVAGRVELAWPVDQVFLAGDYLVELSTGNAWSGSAAPHLRVALADAPGVVLGQLSLTNLPVLGAATRDDRLYLAQGVGDSIYPVPMREGEPGAVSSNRYPLVLTVINLTSLPGLDVLGQTVAQTRSLGWGGDWQAVWPSPDVLVWAGGGPDYWCWYCLDTVPAVGGPTVMGRPWLPYYWGGAGGHLIAFDLSDPTAPVFASEVDLAADYGSYYGWSFSKAFTAAGLVYLSHRTSEFIEGLTSPWQTTGEPVVTIDPVTGQSITNAGVIGTWVQKSYLDVVDYAAPTAPTVRRPVNIPGTLYGLANQGALLFTIGAHWTTNTTYAWQEYLDASAYDGVSAALVDTLPLPTTWPHPALVAGTNVFLGIPGDATVTPTPVPPAIETWALSAEGRFTRLGRVTLGAPASVLAEFPGMLTAQLTDNSLALYDLGDPAALRLIGRGQPAGCWWFDLGRADGERARGLWVPLGAFGVATVPVTP